MLALLLIIVTLVLSAFFSGSEIAYVTANRLKVEVFARRGGVVGPIVQSFLQDPARLLTTTLVGNNLALVIYSTVLALYLEPPLAAFFGGTFGASATEALVLSAQTIIGSTVVLFVGELIPKSLMRERASSAVFAMAVPLRITYLTLLPLIKIAGGVSSLLVRVFRADAGTFSQFMRRDFELMLEESRSAGELELDEDESTLLSNVFALGSIRVKESMLPRTEMVALDETTPLDEVRGTFIASGHSKLPIFRDNIDNIVGVAFAYDLFGEPQSLSAMMRPAKFVPETKLSKDLLQEFMGSKTSIAIVIDEYGGTAGLVTTEDLLEELFGDIQDEFDQEEHVLREVDARTLIVSGRVEIDDINELEGWSLPEGDYETVAGYLLDQLGTIPEPREDFTLDGFRITVLQASANRVELVRLRKSDIEQ